MNTEEIKLLEKGIKALVRYEWTHHVIDNDGQALMCSCCGGLHVSESVRLEVSTDLEQSLFHLDHENDCETRLFKEMLQSHNLYNMWTEAEDRLENDLKEAERVLHLTSFSVMTPREEEQENKWFKGLPKKEFADGKCPNDKSK